MRAHVIRQLAKTIGHLDTTHPVRVGVDGVTAAGKTVLADELAAAIRETGRPVIRAAADGFHHPAEVRYRQGKDSPKGYYEDSFDYDAMKRCLLTPLGPDGSGTYQASVFDFRKEGRDEAEELIAEPNAVLIFEGVMLFRPELVDCWEYRIFVQADFATGLSRALVRDKALLGSEKEVKRKHEVRFRPGQQHYLDMVKPHELADAVVENDDPLWPRLLFRKD